MNGKLLPSLIMAVLFVTGCGAVEIAPTPTPTPPPTLTATPIPPMSTLALLTHAQASEMARSAVTEVVGRVNLIGAGVVETAQGESAFVVTYFTALDGSSEAFKQLLIDVVFAAVEGFVRADPPVGQLWISATSAPGQGQPTTRILVVERSAAEAWFTGQMNTFDFSQTWMTP